MIEVPFWWDRKYESLAATIYSQRPDLFTIPPTSKPIPTHPNEDNNKITSNTTKSIFYCVNSNIT